jgi:hypothetical protein
LGFDSYLHDTNTQVFLPILCPLPAASLGFPFQLSLERTSHAVKSTQHLFYREVRAVVEIVDRWHLYFRLFLLWYRTSAVDSLIVAEIEQINMF